MSTSLRYFDTALATVGATPADAMVVGSSSYADQGRAKVEARNAGLVRIYADRNRGVVKGACLFGPGMDHIAHLFAWAIERAETAGALLQLPFYHPTFEEGLKAPLREICEAIGSPELKDMDSVAAPGGAIINFELAQERCLRWELIGSSRQKEKTNGLNRKEDRDTRHQWVRAIRA